MRSVNGAAARRWVLAPLLGVLMACKSSAPAEPLPAPVQTTTITLTSAGASPRNIEVAAGQRVLFINNDTRSHNMTSDPHPEHDQCPELNQVGFLVPGERRETGNLVTVETCGFHDHDNPDVQSLHGQIVIK
jgi:plastocyanin